MGTFHEGRFGTRIISPNDILTGNKQEIETLIASIAKQYNVGIEDAASALQNTLLRYMHGEKPE